MSPRVISGWHRPYALGLSMLLVLAVAGCGAAGTPTTTADAAPTAAATAEPTAANALASVCEEGATEGEVVYATGFSPEAFEQIVAPFEEMYPEIELTFLAGGDIGVERVITEAAVDRATVDVVAVGFEAQAMVDRGLSATDIDWGALGVDPLLVTDDGAVRLYRIARGLGYNTDLVDPEELPATWEGLADPAFQGRLITDPRGLALSVLSLEMGTDEVAAFAEDLKETVDPGLVEGITASLVAVGSGEYAMTTDARDAEILEQQANGAPLAIHYFDLIPVSEAHQYVVKDAPHPNASRCFVAWMATDEAEARMLEADFKSNQEAPQDTPDGATLLIAETAEDFDLIAETQGALQEVFAPEP